MSIRSLTLSMVCALSALAFGCAATTGSAARNEGRLDVSVNARAGDTLDGSLTIIGLDQPHRTQVAVSNAAATGELELSLPAGLYSVEWTLERTSFDAAELPAPSSPRVVVVSAGGVSTVALRTTRAPGVAAEAVRAAPGEATPVAMR